MSCGFRHRQRAGPAEQGCAVWTHVETPGRGVMQPPLTTRRSSYSDVRQSESERPAEGHVYDAEPNVRMSADMRTLSQRFLRTAFQRADAFSHRSETLPVGRGGASTDSMARLCVCDGRRGVTPYGGDMIRLAAGRVRSPTGARLDRTFRLGEKTWPVPARMTRTDHHALDG